MLGLNKICFLLTILGISVAACGRPAQISTSPTPSARAVKLTPTSTAQLVPAPTSTPLASETLSPQPGQERESSLAITGEKEPELAWLDQAIVSFMMEKGINTGTLAIIRSDKILVEHGYGWLDEDQSIPAPSDTLLRVASLTKPVTAAAIRNLENDGLLDLSWNVFCESELDEDCVLLYVPLSGQEVDPGIYQVTIENLIFHEGGWVAAIDFEPMLADRKIAEMLGLALPISKYDITQYMLGVDLGKRPGEGYSYSNFGYSLLGQIIEEVSGKTYIDYVREHIFLPLGIEHVYLATSLAQDRLPGEAIYACNGESVSVFSTQNEMTCFSYGGFNLENMDSHGGLVASSRAIATFMNSYCIYGRESSFCLDYVHLGALPGSTGIAYWSPDGTKFVLLFNSWANFRVEELIPFVKRLADQLP